MRKLLKYSKQLFEELFTPFLCIGIGVLIGMATVRTPDKMKINDTEVKIVDIMYTYEKDGETVEGDYSIVSDKGYEYTVDGDYSYDYENAKLKY